MKLHNFGSFIEGVVSATSSGRSREKNKWMKQTSPSCLHHRKMVDFKSVKVMRSGKTLAHLQPFRPKKKWTNRKPQQKAKQQCVFSTPQMQSPISGEWQRYQGFPARSRANAFCHSLLRTRIAGAARQINKRARSVNSADFSMPLWMPQFV
jgi:hypothetical protein